MIRELSDETYDLIKKKYGAFIPKIHMINGVKDNVLDFYRGGKEYNYLDFYNKSVLIEPRTPSLNSEKNTILLKTSDENPHNIEVTSTLEQVSETNLGSNSDFQWVCFSSKLKDQYKNSVIELVSDDFNNYKNYFTVIFNFVEKGKKSNTIYDFSLHIKLFLDNPIYYNSDNYLGHDNLKVIYYSKYAYKPYKEAKCICDLNDLGSYKCSFKRYLSIKSKKEYFKELSDHMFDIKEEIPEGKYIEMENIIMNLQKYH